MRYLTIADLKKHLNIETNEDDTYIETIGTAAEQAVENYLQRPLNEYEQGGFLPEAIRHGIRLLVGTFYANREAVSFGSPTVIPFAIEALLNPYINYASRPID